MLTLTDILRVIPPAIAEAVATYAPHDLTELRLRAGLPVSLTTRRSNIRLSVRITRRELDELFLLLCEGSVHAREGSIREGYVPYKGGRIGICGEYSPDGALRSITSLCIRIPHNFHGVASPLVKRMSQSSFSEGAIIYSPPGYGKTTMLRDLAVILSSPPYLKRIALIDTRGELFDSDIMRGCLIDSLEGVDKATGIGLATRALSPELLICDDIGSPSEASAILAAQNTGVPLIASAHASTLTQLLSRPNIKPLADAGIFGLACGIQCNPDALIIDTVNEGTGICRCSNMPDLP